MVGTYIKDTYRGILGGLSKNWITYFVHVFHGDTKFAQMPGDDCDPRWLDMHQERIGWAASLSGLNIETVSPTKTSGLA